VVGAGVAVSEEDEAGVVTAGSCEVVWEALPVLHPAKAIPTTITITAKNTCRYLSSSDISISPL
jgi:hypothetical protein